MNLKKYSLYVLLSFFLVMAFTFRPEYKIQMPLQIEGAWVSIRVFNKNTNFPVENAYVEMTGLYVGNPKWALITDGNGQAFTALPLGDYGFKITHNKYETLTVGPYSVIEHGTNTFTFYLKPSAIIPSGYTVTFYLRDQRNQPITNGAIEYLGQNYPVDLNNGKVLLYNIPSGTHVFRFHGQIDTGGWTWQNFDFTKQIEIKGDIEITVLVAQNEVQPGPPPTPPPNVWDFLGWLSRNWYLVIIGAVGLYVFPHIVKLIGFFKGKES